MSISETRTAPAPAPAVRWWPTAVILTLAAGMGIYIWRFQDVQRQTKNLQSAGLALATLVLLLLWLLLFSRLRWTRRLLWFGGVVALISISAAALEIRGVTGDMVPVLEWRWSKRPSQRLPIEQPTVAPGNTPPPVSSSNDYAQIYGPQRTGELSGPRLKRDWKADPPELLWRQPIGPGWSGFAVVGQYAVTLEQRSESELVSCYGLLTGDLIWTHADASHFSTVIAGVGPRSVPTVFEGRVFTLGPTGILNCLDLLGGTLLWSRNILAENDASAPSWGVSCSPLVTDGKVIVCAGGKDGRSLVAYDVNTGAPIWSGGDDRAAYSSPVLAHIDGVAQTLIFNAAGVKSHDLDTGEILWGYDWPRGASNIVMPVVLPDGRVLISSGYGIGSELIQVSHDPSGSWTATRIWKSNRLKSKFANIIVEGDYIYGLDDGIFVCLDLTSGGRQWKKGRYGHGQLMLVGDLLLVMAENGDLVLLEPTAEQHRELTRFAVLDGKTWNPPALADELLLVRNDKEAACYRLPTVPPETAELQH